MNTEYGIAVLRPEQVVMRGRELDAPSAGGSGFAEKAFLLVLVIAAVPAFLCYKTGNTFLGVAIIGVPIALACLIEPRVSAYAYVFWQAWDSAVVLGDSKQGAWLTPGKMLAFGVLAVALLHLWRRPLRVRSSTGPILWASGFCLIALLSAAWSYDVAKSLRLGLQILVQLLLVVAIVTMVSEDTGSVKRLAFWALLGGVGAAAYIVLFGMDQRAFARATLSEQANPVSAAGALVVAWTFIPLLWVLTRNGLFKLLLIACAGLILFGIVGTGTRAAIGGILGGMAAAAILSGGGRRVRRAVIMTVVLALAYVLGAVAIYSSVIPGQAAVRLAEFMRLPLPDQGARWAGKTSGSREYVWGLAIQGYVDSGILGSGIGASALASLNTTGVYKDVHSNLLGALVEMGPLGLVTFVGMYIAMAICITRLQQRSLQIPAWIVLLSSLTLGFAHTTYTTKIFWLPVTIVLVLVEFDARWRRIDNLQMEGPTGGWGRS